jgi:hypothetical protein
VGVRLDSDGEVLDVLPGSGADRAGLVPGARIAAIDRRRFSPERLDAALRRCAAAPTQLDLLVERDEYFEQVALACREGRRYPRLVRRPGSDDALAAILSPRTTPAGAAAQLGRSHLRGHDDSAGAAAARRCSAPGCR